MASPSPLQTGLLPDALDTLIAHKAISLSADLSTNDKRVASAIIDHFNRIDGRCDPGVERLAGLLNMSVRTVKRATDRLDDLGLIECTRHGGRSNRNSYQPNWARFRQLDGAWKELMAKDSAARRKVTNGARQRDTECHLAEDRPVTQTLLRNQSKEPVPDARREQDNSRPCKPNVCNGPAGTEKRQSFDPLRSRLFPTPASREVAWAAAERRWSDDLRMRFARTADVYVAIIDCIDAKFGDRITEAELKRRGSGVGFLLDELRRRDLLDALGIEHVGSKTGDHDDRKPRQ